VTGFHVASVHSIFVELAIIATKNI
jgi:hypothetical protein